MRSGTVVAMPNRDNDPNDGQSPEDKYSWLYGGSAGDQSPSDQTQPLGQVQGQAASQNPDGLPAMQVPPPSWASARGQGQQPQPGGGAGRGSTSPRGPRRPKGGKRKWPRIILILLVAWVVFLVAVPVWAWSQIEKVDAEPDGDRPGDQGGTTYLLVGSDSRAGLTKKQRKELATGSDGGGRGRTDTIMLMHVGSGPTLLMSIPRDSIVDIPGRGTSKINAAFAVGGPELLVRTIEENTGIRVDDYVEVGFGGFVNVVDALGDVEICPKRNIKDRDAGLDLKKGCQDADGATALGYARSRHSYATQDLQRVQSQREVLGAIAQKTKSPWTVINPVRYTRVASGAASSLKIGDNVGPISLTRFAWNLSAAMGGDGLNCTVPIADTSVRWDPRRSKRMFGLIAADETDKIGKNLCTENGLPR